MLRSRKESRITYTLHVPDALGTALNLLGAQISNTSDNDDRSQHYTKAANLACKVFNEIQEKKSEKENKRSVDRLMRQLGAVIHIYVIEKGYKKYENIDEIRPISQVREHFRALENTFNFYLPDYIPELPNRLEVFNKEERNTMASTIIRNLRHIYYLLLDLGTIIDADTELSPEDKEKEFLLLAKICQVKFHQEYCKFRWLQARLSSVSVLFYENQVNKYILDIEKMLDAPLTKAGINYSLINTFNSMQESLELYERKQAPATTTEKSNRLFRIAHSFSLWAKPLATDSTIEVVKKKLEQDEIISKQAKLFLSLVQERVAKPLDGLVALHELIGFTEKTQRAFFSEVNLNNTSEDAILNKTLTSSLQQIHELYIELTTQEKNYVHALQDQACKTRSFELMEQLISLHEHCRKLIDLLEKPEDRQKNLSVCEGLIILLSPGRAKLFEYEELKDNAENENAIQSLATIVSPT